MADKKFGDGLKTIFLAGVGAVAYTAEKGQEIINELVKKGELTMEQGKDLNKDFQRSFKESMDKKGINLDELGQKLSKMSEEEIAKVKEQISAAEKMIRERMQKAEDIAQDIVNEVTEDEEAAADEVAEAAEEAAVEEAEEEAEAEEVAEVAEEAVAEAEEAIEEE